MNQAYLYIFLIRSSFEIIIELKLLKEIVFKKINWVEHCMIRKCLFKGAAEGLVNEKRRTERKIFQLIDEIMEKGGYLETKRFLEYKAKWRETITRPAPLAENNE